MNKYTLHVNAVLLFLIFLKYCQSEYLSLVKYENNCTNLEYSYGTRCTCTWQHICESQVCNYVTSACDSKLKPFCSNGGTMQASCISSSDVSTSIRSALNKCTPNQMITEHCLCSQEICPQSVYTMDPTLEIVVLNYCSTDDECIRNDYASYTVFPFNGLITGADPQYKPGLPAIHIGGGRNGDD
jgi:hypothetical protein